MKILILSTVILFLSVFAKGQNDPACDSLIITCCAFDSVAPSTLTIYATNNSSNLFDYPGFVLFNLAMDTIAKEEVSYFGIGNSPQPHTLNIVSPLILPFTGYLNLYSLFYDSLECSFPFYIPDTITSTSEITTGKGIHIYPNPAVNEVNIESDRFSKGSKSALMIHDVFGKEIFRMDIDHSPFRLDLDKIRGGIYFLKITGSENSVQAIQKIIVQKKETR